jgi:hypothetical protein
MFNTITFVTAALCGMSGYRQFFESEWLEAILSWQRPEAGCWGLPEDESENTTGRPQHSILVLPLSVYPKQGISRINPDKSERRES